MPIEIKEMHIKINVSEGDKAASSEATPNAGSMVQDCMDQMTKLLNDKDER